jgi:hypothetical protein
MAHPLLGPPYLPILPGYKLSAVRQYWTTSQEKEYLANMHKRKDTESKGINVENAATM